MENVNSGHVSKEDRQFQLITLLCPQYNYTAPEMSFDGSRVPSARDPDSNLTLGPVGAFEGKTELSLLILTPDSAGSDWSQGRIKSVIHSFILPRTPPC